MAVELRYCVIRDGKEAGVFASQEDADALDAKLDRADVVSEILEPHQAELGLTAEMVAKVAELLADNDAKILQGFAPKGKTRTPKKGKPAKGADAESPAKPEKAGRAEPASLAKAS